MTREEIIATTKQVVAEKKAKKAVEENPAKDEKKAKKVREENSIKKEEKAEKVKKPSAKKAEKKVEKEPKKTAKEENKVIVKSFKAFKALTEKNKVRVILEWCENDKDHFKVNFGKPLPKGKGSYFEETKPILIESDNILLWSTKLKVTHLMLNEDFKSQSLNGIPFTIEVIEG